MSGTYTSRRERNGPRRVATVLTTTVLVLLVATAVAHAATAPELTAPAEGATVRSPVTLSGTAAPQAFVSVKENGSVIATATATSSGTWSTAPTRFTPGLHTINATATDAMGESAPSASRTFQVGRPNPPEITTPAEGQVFANPTVTIAGTAEPQALVRVYEGASPIATATAGSNGAWSTSGTFAEGPHAIKATATDGAGAGNESAASANRTFRVDTTPPNPPAISTPSEGSKNGKVVTVSGTATADSKTVNVKDAATNATLPGCNPACGAVPVTVAPGAGNGSWSTQVTFAGTGERRIFATAKDEANNESRPSEVRTFSADGQAPGKPEIERPGTWNTGGTALVPCTESNWDRDICTIGPRYTITGDFVGNAEANVTVAVWERVAGSPDRLLGTTRSYAEPALPGSTPVIRWALRPAEPFAEGKHIIYAKATDDAGNTSDPSIDCVFRVDATPPAAPVIRAPAAGAKLTSAWVDMNGAAEPYSTVTVREGTETVAITSTTPYGDWSVARTFADGEHTIVATATDKYGNVGADSIPVSFTVDGTAPSAPLITTPVAESTVGSPATIAGTAEPGSAVTVRESGTPLAPPVTAGTNGSWSISAPLVEGPHTINATAKDAAGHESPPSADVTFTVNLDPDVAAPPAPEIISPVDGSTHGASVTVSGTAEEGALVEVFDGAASVGTAAADESGAWSLGAVTFASGEHTLTAVATDAAGNDSEPSEAVGFTVDAAAPTVAISTPADNTVFQPGTAVTVTGIASDDVGVDEVAVIFTDAVGNVITVPATLTPTDEGVTWSATANLALGRYAVTARATDIVGNAATSTPAINIVVLSTTTPSPPPVPTPAAPSPSPLPSA